MARRRTGTSPLESSSAATGRAAASPCPPLSRSCAGRPPSWRTGAASGVSTKCSALAIARCDACCAAVGSDAAARSAGPTLARPTIGPTGGSAPCRSAPALSESEHAVGNASGSAAVAGASVLAPSAAHLWCTALGKLALEWAAHCWPSTGSEKAGAGRGGLEQRGRGC